MLHRRILISLFKNKEENIPDFCPGNSYDCTEDNCILENDSSGDYDSSICPCEYGDCGCDGWDCSCNEAECYVDLNGDGYEDECYTDLNGDGEENDCNTDKDGDNVENDCGTDMNGDNMEDDENDCYEHNCPTEDIGGDCGCDGWDCFKDYNNDGVEDECNNDVDGDGYEDY